MIDAINVLPVIMGVVSFMQAKIMQAQQPPATTPEQETQKKMMVWMSLLLPVFLYNGPSGLNLYIMTSTFIGIIESKIVRDHIKQREEAEKAGRVIVDAGKKFGRGGGDSGPIGAAKKPQKPGGGGLMGWLAELQSRAEQIRREADKRGGK